MGFGTDIGGSIRIPAAFNGLYGIRPSSGRLPYEGMANSMDGQNSILSVVGPLSHSVASLRLLIKSILFQQPWLHDPLVSEIPWRDDQDKQAQDLIQSSQGGMSKLAFGFMKHDGAVTPHPPVQRAMDIAVMTLERLGHKACLLVRPEASWLTAFRSLNGNHRRISVATRLVLVQIVQEFERATDILLVEILDIRWRRKRSRGFPALW